MTCEWLRCLPKNSFRHKVNSEYNSVVKIAIRRTSHAPRASNFRAPSPRSFLMNAPDQYQAIVIGSGQGGTPLCMALAGAGLRTALIEREHVGGTCINEGCTPTKTMVASGRVAYLAGRGVNYGV